MRNTSKRSKALNLFIITVIGILAFAHFQQLYGPQDDSAIEQHTHDNQTPPRMTEQSRAHILFGDSTGGGHKNGVGRPCKSEFPAYWSEKQIIDSVEMAAANDNLPWRLESNGYEVAEVRKDDVMMRVVVDPKRNRIVTAYPTNLPRNPCPAPANDR